MEGKDFTLQYRLDQLHRQARMAEAEQARLGALAKNRNGGRGVYSAAMARVGKGLIALGDTLQQRYPGAPEPSAQPDVA